MNIHLWNYLLQPSDGIDKRHSSLAKADLHRCVAASDIVVQHVSGRNALDKQHEVIAGMSQMLAYKIGVR